MLRPSVLLLGVLSIVACGSPPPSAVDDEAILVDLGACMRNDPSCVKSGAVGATTLLGDGDTGLVLEAVIKCGDTKVCPAETQDCCAPEMRCVKKGTCKADEEVVAPEPARISLPIQKPSDDARLQWITLGMITDQTTRRLNVALGPNQTLIEPSRGVVRLELSGHDAKPAADARLELTATHGVFAIAWVVGRWNH